MLPLLLVSAVSYGQYFMHAQPLASGTGGTHIAHHNGHAMTGGRNYSSFTLHPADKSDEVLAANKGFENDPELGVLYEGAPAQDCYEVLGKRTEINKTFVRKGTNGLETLTQTSNMPMHYKDASGQWRTIKAQLAPDAEHPGIFAAYEQPSPIAIDTRAGKVSIGKAGATFTYNNGLELVYELPDGLQKSLGKANWSNYRAGDDGVYVTDAWDGVDIEMYVIRGAVKTNFIINKALPQYAGGSLLVRDHPQMDPGMTLFAEGKTTYSGNMELRDMTGTTVYNMSAATVCERDNVRGTLQMLNYKVGEKNLDIVLPGNFLNRDASSYPVIIDPLVSLATSSTVTGSSYSVDFTVPCVYSNAATVPANITITDIQFAFTYATSGGAWLEEGATDFRRAGCRSPTGATGIGGSYWYCLFAGPGTCASTGGATYSIYADLSACIPAPQCPSYNLNLTMDFYQDYIPTAACATTYIYATTPLVITVIGHTVELISATASPTTICSGSSSTLTGSGHYGVAPYTYTWTPGPLTGSPVTVSPTTTTTYTLTITDACGITATGTTTVTVNTEAPITGTATVCVGNTTLLADATGGAHSWTSSNTAIATVTAGGVVTGVAAGTANITYTSTGTGCYAVLAVTVTPLPGVIGGTPTVCVGGTTVLTDGTAGGTWTSSNTAIATIGAGTGTVTGVAAGTCTMTYSLGGSCYVTELVTVTNVAAILGTTTLCAGATSTLTDATAGGTWSSGTTSVATISATGVVTAIAAGTSIVSYTTAGGCSQTVTIVVNAIAPITGTLSVCVGNTTALADAAGVGTWTSSNTAVATVGSTTGVVTGVAAGTATITFTTSSGCSVTALVTVNDVAAIAGPTTLCTGQTINLTDATAGGTWSSGATGVATVVAGTGAVTGVSNGTATITYTSGAGCTSTYMVNVSAIAPVTGTTSLCVGATTTLADAAGAGTWSSSSTATATVGATTGIVTGVAAGTVTISFNTASGCSASASVVVNGIPVISGTESVCVGNTTPLTASVAGGTWSSMTTTIATIGATGVVSGVAAGTSVISYTSPAGCSSSAVVTVNPLPAAIAGSSTVCQGYSVTLTDATTGGTWSVSPTSVATIGTTSGILTGVSGGTATVTYTSAAGCTTTSPFTVSGTPPMFTGSANICLEAIGNLTDATPGGTWISGTPAVATINATSGAFSGVGVGVATITYTSPAGCFISGTVTVNPLPSPISGINSICVGATSNLQDSLPGGSWTSSDPTIATIAAATGGVNGLVAGTCTMTYTAAGCSTTELFTVNPIPPAIAGLSNICVGFFDTLSNGIAGGTWTSGNPTVASVNPTSGILTAHDQGVATITYTTAAGCTTTGSVTINLAPKVSFYVNPNVCIGDSVIVELTASSTNITSYAWDFGGANVLASSSNTFGPFQVKWTTAGTYFVTVTATANVICPSLTVQDTVLVHNPPDASIQPIIIVNGSGGVCLGDSVLLRSNTADQSYRYTWNPLHYFEQNNLNNVYGRIELPGYVYLTVADPFGCTATDSLYINAQSCCQVSFPTAFTPNNDGLNDIFRPVGLGNHGIHSFTITNRWGQVVYETVESKIGWNGMFNGIPQEIGTYFYYFSYECEGKTVYEKGEVTLVR